MNLRRPTIFSRPSRSRDALIHQSNRGKRRMALIHSVRRREVDGFRWPEKYSFARGRGIFESEHGLCISVDVLRLRAAFFVPGKFPFPLRFHTELHTRKSFGSGFEGARYKFDVDMDMESNIPAYLVSPCSSRLLVSETNVPPDFPDALLGDRTVSDLSGALILRLSCIRSNMLKSLLVTIARASTENWFLFPRFKWKIFHFYDTCNDSCFNYEWSWSCWDNINQILGKYCFNEYVSVEW